MHSGNLSLEASEHSWGALSSSTSTIANDFLIQMETWKGRLKRRVNLSLMRLMLRKTFLITSTTNML